MCKYPLLLLSDFNEGYTFSIDFQNILKCQTLWKSAQWEPSRSMGTDRQTDVTSLIVSFRDFANLLKNVHKVSDFELLFWSCQWKRSVFICDIRTVSSVSIKCRLIFHISNFRRVLNVVFFLLGDSPSSEFLCRCFGTSYSIFVGGVS